MNTMRSMRVRIEAATNAHAVLVDALTRIIEIKRYVVVEALFLRLYVQVQKLNEVDTLQIGDVHENALMQEIRVVARKIAACQTELVWLCEHLMQLVQPSRVATVGAFGCIDYVIARSSLADDRGSLVALDPPDQAGVD